MAIRAKTLKSIAMRPLMHASRKQWIQKHFVWLKKTNKKKVLRKSTTNLDSFKLENQ